MFLFMQNSKPGKSDLWYFKSEHWIFWGKTIQKLKYCFSCVYFLFHDFLIMYVYMWNALNDNLFLATKLLYIDELNVFEWLIQVTEVNCFLEHFTVTFHLHYTHPIFKYWLYIKSSSITDDDYFSSDLFSEKLFKMLIYACVVWYGIFLD